MKEEGRRIIDGDLNPSAHYKEDFNMTFFFPLSSLKIFVG
jgi:hypothetical protein